MFFLFVNKTFCQTTKEPYGFKMQIFKVLFSKVRDPTDKCLYLYDLEFSFSGLLKRCIGLNYEGETYCRIPSNSGLK